MLFHTGNSRLFPLLALYRKCAIFIYLKHFIVYYVLGSLLGVWDKYKLDLLFLLSKFSVVGPSRE